MRGSDEEDEFGSWAHALDFSIDALVDALCLPSICPSLQRIDLRGLSSALGRHQRLRLREARSCELWFGEDFDSDSSGDGY